MIIISFLITGLILFVAAIISYKMSRNFAHLLMFFIGLFIIVFIPIKSFAFISPAIIGLIVPPVIIGLTTGHTLKNNKDLQFFIIVSSLTITFISTFYHYYLKIFRNIDIIDILKDTLISLHNVNNIPDSEKNQILQYYNDFINLFKDVEPFYYFLNSLTLSFIGLYFLKFIFRKLKVNKKVNSMLLKFNKVENNENTIEEKSINGIERFKINEYLIFLFIAGWFIVLLVDKTEYYFLYIIGLNIALIFSCFYLIQALGIIKFLFAKKGLPILIVPGIILPFLFLGIYYFLFMLIILAGIGAVDFWADFRKLNIDTKNI